MRALFAGDVVYRTLAAHRLGMPATEAEVPELAVPLLAELLLDPYPNVRRTAIISLARLTGRSDLPQALDALEERRRAYDLLTARPARAAAAGWPYLDEGKVDRGILAAWTGDRIEVPISIGE